MPKPGGTRSVGERPAATARRGAHHARASRAGRERVRARPGGSRAARQSVLTVPPHSSGDAAWSGGRLGLCRRPWGAVRRGATTGCRRRLRTRGGQVIRCRLSCCYGCLGSSWLRRYSCRVAVVSERSHYGTITVSERSYFCADPYAPFAPSSRLVGRALRPSPTPFGRGATRGLHRGLLPAGHRADDQERLGPAGHGGRQRRAGRSRDPADTRRSVPGRAGGGWPDRGSRREAPDSASRSPPERCAA